jgi:putative ABC transport system permease protein
MSRLTGIARLALGARGHVPLAWRNATARRPLFLRAVLGVGFAAFLIFMQLGFREAFLESSLVLIRSFDADLIIQSRTNYQFGQREPFPRRRLQQALSHPDVSSAAPVLLEWQSSRWKNPDTGKTYHMRVLGFDPDRPSLLLPDVTRHRDALRQPNTIVMDSRARRHLGEVRDGLRTELAGREITVVGTAPIGPDFFIDGTLFMSERNFLMFFEDPDRPGQRREAADYGLVKLRPGASLADTQAALQAALPSDVTVVTKDELIAHESAFQASVSPVGLIFGLGAVIGFCAGVLITYQVLFTEIINRQAQYATLKAIGYERDFLLAVIARQSLIYALAGFAGATLAAVAVYAAVDAIVLLPMQMSSDVFWVTMIMCLVMCLIAGFTAARRAVAADPAEMFG